MTDREAFTTGQVASICNVAVRTVVKWFDTGIIESYRIPLSNDRRVTRSNLIKFLRENNFPLGFLREEIRVLIIGDGVDDVKKVRDALPLNGQFMCAIARNGFEAGIRAMESHYDFVVIDMLIGRSEAMAIAATIKEMQNYEHTILIAVANEDDGDNARLIEAGFDEVYQRPLDHQALAKRLMLGGIAVNIKPKQRNKFPTLRSGNLRKTNHKRKVQQ